MTVAARLATTVVNHPYQSPVGNCLAFDTLLVVGNSPAPLKCASAAIHDALTENIRDLVTIASEKRLGGAHFRTKGQFPFCHTVTAVLTIFLAGIRLFWATRTEGAFIHLATRAKRARFWKLGRTEGACVEAVTTPDTDVFVVQYHTIVSGVEAVNRTNRSARSLRAVHAGH